MPAHPDALGYLTDLAAEIDKPWFKMVCDLATESGTPDLDQTTLEILFAVYKGIASPIGLRHGAVTPSAAAPASPADFIEGLSGFANFKLLGDTLEVCFKKRLTLIFGANGSGKSSLCESLKALAHPDKPTRPLLNVRAASAGAPTFGYKFKSDPGLQKWTPSAGYGMKASTIKYFDATIAIQNVAGEVEPGRVIFLTPFKLHIFEWATALTTRLRTELQQAQKKNSESLTRALTEIRTMFAAFNSRPLATIEEETLANLPAQIKLGEEFTDNELLTSKQAAAAALEQAGSEAGLRLLRVEHRDLGAFLTALELLLKSASEIWTLDPASKNKILEEKQVAQEALARAMIPKGRTLDELLALLRSASPMCKMDEAAGLACPLCKRDLGAAEVELFKQYHALVVGKLGEEITEIKDHMDRARQLVTAICQADRKEWDKFTIINDGVRTDAKTVSDVVIASCNISRKPTSEAQSALESLKAAADKWAVEFEAKNAAIEATTKGRAELAKQLMESRADIEPLEYGQSIAKQLDKLRAAQSMAEEASFWSEELPKFTQVLRRVTEKAKEAHADLVVSDFEARLNAEYLALAEKDMEAFGVSLTRKGAGAAVTVLPRVGGKEIRDVLSEGEQRLHALALFFAELEACPQSVLVFDDPISSFDYNYIANYCARLREAALKYPEKQIVVLTHNWEFFVQLQTTMNNTGLSGDLSVYVLENCMIVSEYSDRINDLKRDIDGVLAATGEPTKKQKEETAAKMRRLIEAVVNTHAFNDQRHQFKQKNQPVSTFQKFTKLVALLPDEATTLRDLYARLSVAEHDDPRAAFVNTDKAMFQNRYNQILGIEAAIRARIPR